jgi:hypothetical protein
MWRSSADGNSACFAPANCRVEVSVSSSPPLVDFVVTTDARERLSLADERSDDAVVDDRMGPIVVAGHQPRQNRVREARFEADVGIEEAEPRCIGGASAGVAGERAVEGRLAGDADDTYVGVAGLDPVAAVLWTRVVHDDRGAVTLGDHEREALSQVRKAAHAGRDEAELGHDAMGSIGPQFRRPWKAPL